MNFDALFIKDKFRYILIETQFSAAKIKYFYMLFLTCLVISNLNQRDNLNFSRQIDIFLSRNIVIFLTNVNK
jgi:hypothetical protein